MRLYTLTFLMRDGGDHEALEIECQHERFKFMYIRGLRPTDQPAEGYDLGQAARKLTKLQMADDPQFSHLPEPVAAIVAKAFEDSNRRLLANLMGEAE